MQETSEPDVTKTKQGTPCGVPCGKLGTCRRSPKSANGTGLLALRPARLVRFAIPVTPRRSIPLGTSTSFRSVAFGSASSSTIGTISIRSTSASFRAVACGTIPLGATSAPEGTGALAGPSELGTQFVGRQFAVFVLVELLERCGGLGDLVGGDGAVLVEIQSVQNRNSRSSAIRTARSAESTSAEIATRTPALRTSIALARTIIRSASLGTIAAIARSSVRVAPTIVRASATLLRLIRAIGGTVFRRILGTIGFLGQHPKSESRQRDRGDKSGEQWLHERISSLNVSCLRKRRTMKQSRLSLLQAVQGFVGPQPGWERNTSPVKWFRPVSRKSQFCKDSENPNISAFRATTS